MSEEILVVDIGNTSTSIGIFTRGRVSGRKRVPTAFERASSARRVIRDAVKDRNVTASVLCSVVPRMNTFWRESLKEITGSRTLLVKHTLDLGVPVSYPDPKTIGPDRLANACGAARRHGTPVVVADFGTALTFDVVHQTRGYIGGIIAPGLPLMFRYLADKTALLPEIEPGPTRHAVGKSTEEAMRIGARYGYRGMVREILEHLRNNLRGDSLTLCATGGFAAWVLRGLDMRVHYEEDLTLYGLGCIYELNKGRKR